MKQQNEGEKSLKNTIIKKSLKIKSKKLNPKMKYEYKHEKSFLDEELSSRKSSTSNSNSKSSGTKVINFDESIKRSQNKRNNQSTPQPTGAALKYILSFERKKLPIYSAREQLLHEIKENQINIVIGETGSGKTTQIPQYLYEEMRNSSNKQIVKGKIAITQPRRVAAMTVSSRVADEVGTELGGLVGYTIRFDDRTTHRTQLKFCTDGMLLREAMLDPLLSEYSVIILDEAHERTISTDLLMSVLRDLTRKRRDLKLVVMSATLDAKSFSSFFDDAKVLYIQGRQYPVRIYHTPEPVLDYLDSTVTTVMQIHNDHQTAFEEETSPALGDILVFLPGQEDIESVETILRDRLTTLSSEQPEIAPLIVTTIYAALPPEQQIKVFEKTPDGQRKVILATNIAETSITINGVRWVVDCGLVKSRYYSPRSGMDALLVVPVSKQQAAQRTGRAGREAAGFCYRLYTEKTFNEELLDAAIPEIRRANLSHVLLQLKALGIDDIFGFPFMDRPSDAILCRSLETLVGVGALDRKEGALTLPLGKTMAQIPLDPLLSKCLYVAATEFRCSVEILSILSMLATDSIFFQPRDKLEAAATSRRKYIAPEGDHLTLLNLFSAWASTKTRDRKSWASSTFINYRSMTKVDDIRSQLERYCKSAGLPLISALSGTSPRYDDILKSILAGFVGNLALRQPDGSYLTMYDSQQVFIHPTSTLFGRRPPLVLFHELVLTTKKYMRTCSAIDANWISHKE